MALRFEIGVSLLHCIFSLCCVVNRLYSFSSSFLMQNVVSPQAFMSSSIATEAVQESSTSKAYGSEQIQGTGRFRPC
ncbi:unnamed protein product [Camellia sinensis]